jgi:inhibitor of KinA sporulation pathway (predicted exonuclease)
MMAMLNGLQIEHAVGLFSLRLSLTLIQGRHHSGIDDVRNICSVVRGIAENAGYVYRPTWVGGDRERKLVDTSDAACLSR